MKILLKVKKKYDNALNDGIIFNNFLDNKIFDEYFLAENSIVLQSKDYKKAQHKEGQKFKIDAKKIEKLKEIASVIKQQGEEFYKQLSESDIEDKIVTKILDILGFNYTLKQQTRVINGIENRFDYVCFENNDSLNLFLNEEEDNNNKSNFMIVEVKKWGANFESGKPVDRPLRQIIQYLILNNKAR